MDLVVCLFVSSLRFVVLVVCVRADSVIDSWLFSAVSKWMKNWTKLKYYYYTFIHIYYYYYEARRRVVGWGTMLQAKRSWVRFPRSLDFSIYLAFKSHYGSGFDSALNRN
jgi:hypothetical protein